MVRSSFLRNSAPITVGFILGSALSLFLFPTIQESEDECARSSFGKEANAKIHSLIGGRSAQSLQSPGQSHLPNGSATGTTLKSSSGSTTKTGQKPPNRPRFCATELGIKDKLFVGVLTSKENLQTTAAAINKTVAHHVSRLVFFVDSPSPSEPTPAPRFLNLVNIAAGTPDNLKPFAILNHMAGRGQTLANNYDWFFFMPDSVYLKAFKLFELVSHISFGYDVQIGRPWHKNGTGSGSASPYCDFNAGILLSFGLMRSLIANLRQCMKDIDPTLTASENFGRCILSTNRAAVCSEEWNNKAYRSWQLSTTTQIANDLKEMVKHDPFNSALAVYPITSVSDIYYLHKYYCNQEIDQVNQLISTVEEGLINSALSNDGSEELTWPPGSPAQSRQRSRYDVFKWDYFTSTDIFESSNDRNVRPLSGVNEKDVKAVVNYATNELVEKYPSMKFQRLLSGYRRFDPRRGMEYILDLSFISSIDSRNEIRKRVHLIRPLNRVELVPAPYVTEATPVIIVIPVAPTENDAAQDFLNRFSRICLDANENAKVIFILSYETLADQDAYRSLKSGIDMVRKKYPVTDTTKSQSQQQPRVDYVHIRASTPSPFLVMDIILQSMGQSNLYLLATPWTEIYGDFLNRVRMNTIKEYQVFVPVPFTQFNPKITRRQKGGAVGVNQDHIDVHKYVGRFDWHDFGIVSFYGSDYSRRRQAYSQDSEHLHLELDLVSVFLNSDIHVFRAVEPALKIRYHEKWCSPKLANDLYNRCSWSRKEGLGMKAQLAHLLLEDGAISDGL